MNLNDLAAFDADLCQKVEDNPAEYLFAFEKAAAAVLRSMGRQRVEEDSLPQTEVQVMVHRETSRSGAHLSMIRDLTSRNVSRLVTVRGIVTAASKPRNKATHVTIQCSSCRATKTLVCKGGVGAVTVPRTCDNATLNAGDGQKCPLDPYVILPHRSRHVDQQSLKLQELTEDIRDGDLPRSIVLVADRHLVNRVVPGARVTIYGIYSIYTQAPGNDK